MLHRLLIEQEATDDGNDGRDLTTEEGSESSSDDEEPQQVEVNEARPNTVEDTANNTIADTLHPEGVKVTSRGR